MVSFIDFIVKGLECKQKDIISIFPKFSKAFDHDDFETLFIKLERSGVRGLSLYWIKSCMHGRTQIVQVAGSL